MFKSKIKPVESLKRFGWRLVPLGLNTAFLEHFCALCGAIMVLVGCSTVRYVPTESRTITNYVDSTLWNIRDSVVLVPHTIYKDYTGLLDTLYMTNANCDVKAWADTAHNILNGSIESKSYVLRETKIEYRDRIVEKVDSVYVEVPVEVTKEVTKVPKWSWYSLGWSVLTILIGLLALYLKLKK